MPAERLKDLTGFVFGNLTVLRFGEKRKKNYYWVCLCKCGKELMVYSGSLKKGVSRSCGCSSIVGHMNNPEKRHGMTHTRIYNIWSKMMGRCYNKNGEDYHNYGGRGITVCERWHNFKLFYLDTKEGYSDELSIDRFPNNDGNYEPNNWRWATWEQQQGNRRNNHIVEHGGKKMILADWARLVNLKESTLLYRLKIGWSKKSALTTPVSK